MENNASDIKTDQGNQKIKKNSTTLIVRRTRLPNLFTAKCLITPVKAVPSLSPSTLPTFSTSMSSCCLSEGVMTELIPPTRRLTLTTTSECVFLCISNVEDERFCLTCGFVFTGHQTSWNLYVRACCGSGLSRDAKVNGGCIF